MFIPPVLRVHRHLLHLPRGGGGGTPYIGRTGMRGLYGMGGFFLEAKYVDMGIFEKEEVHIPNVGVQRNSSPRVWCFELFVP